MTIRTWSRAGRRTIGAHGGVISPADGAGVSRRSCGPSWAEPVGTEISRTGGRFSAAQRAAGSSGSGWNAVWEPSQILISLIREFWPDSLLEEDGFEPSVPRERERERRGRWHRDAVIATIVGATQRCAPLFARLLLLEARAAAPWLPGPRGGRRGLAAAYPIQPPRLRGGGRGCARSQWSEAKRALTPSE